MQVNDDIRPFRELDHRQARNQCRDELDEPIGQIIPFIVADRAVLIEFHEDVDEGLPGFQNRLDEDDEVHPGSESLPIICDPTSDDLADDFEITEYLRQEFLLPIEVFPEFLRELLVLFKNLDVLIDRRYELIDIRR